MNINSDQNNYDSSLANTPNPTPASQAVSDTQLAINQKVVGIINKLGKKPDEMLHDLEVFFRNGSEVSGKVIYQCKELYGISKEVENFLEAHKLAINQNIVGIINKLGKNPDEMLHDLEVFFRDGSKVSGNLIYQCKELYGISKEVENFLEAHKKD